METYEGLVRKVYTSKTKPAVLLVHNVFYNNGANAQLMHGRIENREITPDDLHPNDAGHALVASVITYFLDKVKTEDATEQSEPDYPTPLTKNTYEKSNRHQNSDENVVCHGFVADTSAQRDITDCFKHGWTASKKGC